MTEPCCQVAPRSSRMHESDADELPYLTRERQIGLGFVCQQAEHGGAQGAAGSTPVNRGGR